MGFLCRFIKKIFSLISEAVGCQILLGEDEFISSSAHVILYILITNFSERVEVNAWYSIRRDAKHRFEKVNASKC